MNQNGNNADSILPMMLSNTVAEEKKMHSVRITSSIFARIHPRRRLLRTPC
jgi:hypothetical protein